MSGDVVVLRAPLRSRDDTVDPATTLARALAAGVVGSGRRGLGADDDRAARRRDRFAAVPDGAYVWTRSPEGYLVGRIRGPWRRDDSLAAREADLVDVRPCDWIVQPVPATLVPPAVVATFARGGRNLQRIGDDPAVAAETQAAWDRMVT